MGMNRLLAIILLFFSLAPVKGQNTLPYYTFPVSNANWSVSSWLYDHLQNVSFCQQTCYYGIWGDTIINGYTYHKIYTNIYPNSSSQFFDTTLATYLYSFRESGRKIAVRGPGDPADVLHYDFNVDPGDTATFNYDVNLYPSPLISIDSVYTTDGYRRRFNFTYDEWIEGIGSTRSSRYPYFYYRTNEQPLCTPTYSLECFIENDTIKYSRFGYCTCSYLNGVDDIDVLPGLTLSPNPANYSVNISNSGKRFHSVFFRDVTGKLVKEIRGEYTAVEIPLEDLAPGIYFIKVDAGSVVTRKLVITR